MRSAICALSASLTLAASEAVPFEPGLVSSSANDYNFSADAAGRTAVFARSAADFAEARILMTERGGRGWSRPRPAPFTDDRWRDSDPWLTPDGATLYFVSDRPTAERPDKRDLDIWRSERRQGTWSAPEHLGNRINGLGDELGPELHQGILYYAAARRSGLGGLDIYRSAIGPDGPAAPELLPGPFNTSESESDFTLAPDSLMAVFWRSAGGRGLLHLSRRTESGWSEPQPLGAHINVGPFNFTPAFLPGGQLAFSSTRSRDGQADGMADIYIVDLESPNLAGSARNPASLRQTDFQSERWRKASTRSERSADSGATRSARRTPSGTMRPRSGCPPKPSPG